MQSRLRTTLALALLAAVVYAPTATAQTTVDFNAEPDGAAIPLAGYESAGVLFAVTGGTFQGFACDDCSSFGVPSASGPNYAKLAGGADVTASFVDPGSGAAVEVTDVSLYLFSFTFGATIRTFLADGTPGPECANAFFGCPFAVPTASPFTVNLAFPGPVAVVEIDSDGTDLVVDDLGFTLPDLPPPSLDPESKADCKRGGWADFGFRNQGQCIRFVNTGKDSR